MLVVMSGLPGTGKSTVARALQPHLGAVVLDKDTIRSALFSPAYIEYSREQDDLCAAVMLQVAAWHLQKHPQRSVILDGRTYSYAYQRQTIMDIAQEIPAQVHWIVCTCSDITAKRRLAHDHKHGSHPAQNRTPELYEAVKARYESFTLPHLKLNTDQPVERCVKVCMAYLTGGSHASA